MPRTRRQQLNFPINIRELTVAKVEDITAGMRRITLTGDQLGAFTTEDGIAVPALRNEGFDDHVKVIVPGPGQEHPVPPVQVEGHLDWNPEAGRPTGKDYTPRRWDPEAGEIVLDFVRHSHGFASTWVAGVHEGDSAWIAGPKESALLPTDVDWMLVVGDETALPAIGRLVEELPNGMRAQVFIEVADPSHQVPLARREGVEVTWLHRGSAAPGTTDLLEQAVRNAEWWPGEVYAWAAGEAITLKPLRAHLKHERRVPADCLEVTGYWRRSSVQADASGIPVEVEVDQDDERIDALVDLTSPVVLRAAATIGLLEELDRGRTSLAALASQLGVHPRPLAALLRFLRAAEVIAPDEADPALQSLDAPVALAPLGVTLAQDEELLEELRTDGPGAFLDLLPADLLHLLRTGAPAPRADGRLAAEVIASGDPLAVAHRQHRGESAVRVSPTIALHHDWSAHDTVTVLGASAPETATKLLREFPHLQVRLIDLPSVLAAAVDGLDEGLRDRITLIEQSPLAPLTQPVGDAVLVVRLLDQLNDVDAVHVLENVADALDEAALLVVELTLEADEEVHDHDAELDLQLLTAFGSGVRAPAAFEALFSHAGLTPRAPGAQSIGWDLTLWQLMR
ncbi:SIP domain-containing protein [Nocardioides alcanivorans]|uniref:SIP domain-containing protein n=1 Tax=Nocardioides alcanivorans TaxID=2897352 RepID=UPI001F1A636D|nr:SIP domain-containing protein [Nocardioides alcanivorans]